MGKLFGGGEAVQMLERMEKVFRAINRAPDLRRVLISGLEGLEELIPGSRARLVPQSFELLHRLQDCDLDSSYILMEGEQEVLKRAQEFGQTIRETSGVDPARIHCCIVPLRGGLVYLDGKRPFTADDAAIAGMVTQQLVASLGSSNLALTVNQRDTLSDLPNELWFNNQMQDFKEFSVVALDIDGFHEFNQQRGWEAGDTVLCELVGFLRQKLGSEELLARVQCDEFLVLTLVTDRNELTKMWRGFLEQFEAVGVASRYNLTISAGLATFPASDSDRQRVKELAQRTCHLAARLGNRLMAAAAPGEVEMSLLGDPRSYFDGRSSAAVRRAIRECQARQRDVDARALLWGILKEERDISTLLRDSGLKYGFQESLIGAAQERTDFTESAQAAFGASLRFAHRAGRKTVGLNELLLACLADSETERELAERGLRYGALMTGLYEAGRFTSLETFLVGSLQRRGYGPPAPKGRLVQNLPVARLPDAFGQNFSAEVWALLATARTEAKAAEHDLGMEHLYLAILIGEGGPVERGRAVLRELDIPCVPPETSTLTSDLRSILNAMDRSFSEVTIKHLADRLRMQVRVKRFIAQIED